MGDGFAKWARFEPAPDGFNESTKGIYQFTPNVTVTVYPQIGFTTPLLLPLEDVRAIGDKYAQLGKDYLFTDEYYADLDYTRIVGAKIGSNRTAYEEQTPSFWVGGCGFECAHVLRSF